MNLACVSSACIALEICAKAMPEKVRAGGEAVCRKIAEVVGGAAWCAFGARAVGAENSNPVSVDGVDAYGASKAGIPTGIRTPVSRLRIWRPRPG